MTKSRAVVVAGSPGGFATAAAAQERVMTSRDLVELPTPAADRRIAYGEAPQQFGDLRLPAGKGPFPVVVLVHGGCWMAEYDLSHLSSLAEALRREGFATWSLEYRRIGDPGGGWPGTFQDVAAGADHLRALVGAFPLDLRRVAFAGHSAGGHLALWLAGRHNVPAGGSLRPGGGVRPRGVVSLAGVTDLAAGASLGVCGDAIPRLLGGPPAGVPDRVRASSPIALVPLGVPQTLVVGGRDTVVPGSLASAYAAAAGEAGDTVEIVEVAPAGHFELVTPGSAAWPAVRDAVLRAAGAQSPRSAAP